MTKPILIIDANREFGILIRQSLEEGRQYQATLVHSGQQAIETASDQRFELALIDFGLPDMPGAEVVRQLKDLNPGISIVAIPIDGRAEELESLEVAGVLMKPFYLPDLPRIIDKALTSQSFKSNWIQWEQSEKPRVQPTTTEPPKPKPKAVQQSPSAELPAESQPAAKASPIPLDQLEIGVERIGARAALLWDGRRPVAQVGLTRDQLEELADPLTNLGEHIQRKRAVTCYVQLPDQGADSLLYASPWGDGLSLVVLYPAATAFRQVRRGVQQLADQLEQGQATADAAASEVGRQAPDPSESLRVRDEIPEDWIPEAEFSPSQRALLEELAAIEPPPPDPAPVTPALEPDRPPAGSPDLPDDWIPTNRRPEELLAMIEEPKPNLTTEPAPASQHKPPGDQLEYNLVLVPRFPEHRFTGPLADQLPDWVRRICLAWDWRAQQIQVGETFVRLRLKLNADSAPSQAVQQIKADLARHILSAQTDWNAVLPSGRFFAQRHLLTAGSQPNQEQILGFIGQLRSSQGLSA